MARPSSTAATMEVKLSSALKYAHESSSGPRFRFFCAVPKITQHTTLTARSCDRRERESSVCSHVCPEHRCGSRPDATAMTGKCIALTCAMHTSRDVAPPGTRGKSDAATPPRARCSVESAARGVLRRARRPTQPRGQQRPSYCRPAPPIMRCRCCPSPRPPPRRRRPRPRGSAPRASTSGSRAACHRARRRRAAPP